MLMLRPRAIARPLILALVLLVTTGPLLRAESHAASPASSVQGGEPYNLASPVQFHQAQASGALQPAQGPLNRIVKVSLQSAGWNVIKLSSQLGDASEQFDGNHLSNSGLWHVEALDEKEQSVTLDGVLTFTLQTEARPSQGFNVIKASGLSNLVSASSTVTGTLSGSGVEAAIDLSTAVQNSDDATRQQTNLTVRMLQNGQESIINSTGSSESRLVAYNTGRQVITSTLERAGKRIEATQTMTVRSLGHVESEIWLDSSAVDADGGKLIVSTSQHLFQRTVGDTASQYIDRFDLTNPFSSYTLKEPGTATVNLGDLPVYNYVLVDKNGTELKPGGPAGIGRAPGLSSVLPRSANSSSNPSGGYSLADEMRVTYSLAAPPAQSRGGSGVRRNSAGRTPDEQAAKEAQAAVVVGGAVAVAITGGAAAADRAAAQAASDAAAALGGGARAATAVTVAGEDAAATAAASEAAATGAGTFSGGLSSANIARKNADPYFVYPDVRPNADAVNPSPLQITRVTGGLVTTMTMATLAVTATGGVTLTLPSGSAPLYGDDPVPFVGGGIPVGAGTVGEWTWDSSRPYGAVPAHTQARTDGPQMHYFIHASAPLTATQDTNIIQYVYLDPQHPPKEIYLQFYTGDGDGERRAYWGEDLVQTGGKRGTSSLYPMGALPAAGGWVRLQLPADKLGLVGNPANGVLFGAYGGQTWWGPTTTSNRLLDSAPDGTAVQGPAAMVTTTHGSSIAFRLAEPARLTITIVDAQGKIVRSLARDAATDAGYRVAVWDARDDAGAAVADAPYRVQFSVDGKPVAEHAVTITPLVADIEAPGAYSLVRGNQVPVTGEASGDGFSHYVLEYGEGLSPSSWKMIVDSRAPALLQPGAALRSFNPGNIANWNVGVDEYLPWKQPGLNGLFTLRLRVIGQDGREASDSVPVVVGRLAHTAEGGTITSPDGKAKLSIPPLATTSPFSILALVPLSQLEPDGAWRSNLPASNTNLVGEVYEVLPADEAFRRPATLELAYTPGTAGGANGSAAPQQVGVMLGDGTRDGWRYIGGMVDTQRGVVSVPVSDFGGKRALVAVFSSASFVPPADGSDGARLPFSSTLQAPTVVSSTAPFAFYSDLESSPGEWEALDRAGTRLERVAGAGAGMASGSVLKVTHTPGGERLLGMRSSPYDAARYPVLSFDYRLPTDYAPDILVHSNGIWWQLLSGTGGSSDTRYFQSLYAPKFLTDDAWHHYQIDLLGLLRSGQPAAPGFQVDAVVLGQAHRIAYMQVDLIDTGEADTSYYIDNFAALRPTNAADLQFSWAMPAGTSLGAYSFALDSLTGTVPPEASATTVTGATVSLPAGAGDGLLYFHLRGQGPDGLWGATTHFPLLLDRQPPQVGRPQPPPGGAGSPDGVEVPLVDAGGVDITSVRVDTGGTAYSWTKAAGKGGLQYEPQTGSLFVYPNLLEPRPPEVAASQKAEITVREMADYAGNKLAAPFSWSFTVDRPEVSGDPQFKQLTQAGGSSPAVSPDASLVAFVSTRSGGEKVWVMRADDYGETAGSAKPLTGAGSTGREADPAWSPDGKALAFVSDAGGSEQVWTAAPDGSGTSASPLTKGDGGAASPTWLADGKTLAFIRDGNLWEVRADGTGLHALTGYPERPLRSVRSQPGGSLLVVGFKLYQESVELYDPGAAPGTELSPLTGGGKDREPAWLNSTTLLYTAPATQNGLDAIWQTATSGGGGASVLPGSSHPGAADMQPHASQDGSALAIVSTRGGDRNVWLRQTLQIASLQVAPSVGAAPGEKVQVSYTLPTSATVTLAVVDSAGKSVRVLLDGVAQDKGAQTVEWDGTGAGNAALPAGDYVVSLAAKLGSGAGLTRRAPARLLAASDIGTLRLQIEQWAGQAVAANSDLSVVVYSQGTRAEPVAMANGDSNPSFQLPAGRYDVLSNLSGARVDTLGITVEAGKEVLQKVDLGLGGLNVALMLAAGRPVTGDAYVAVSRSGDPSGVPLLASYSPTPAFVLPPGKYDLKMTFRDIKKTVYGVQVKRGQATSQEVALGGGILKLSVYSSDGVPGDGSRLRVQLFDPRNHDTAVATTFDNPSELTVPSGTYDVRVEYGAVSSREENRVAAGNIVSWLKGVVVQEGQTAIQEDNLKLTPVTVTIQEAQGKALVGDSVAFYVYPKGESSSNYIAYSYTDTVHLELQEGIYNVKVDYSNTELRSAGPVGGDIEVKYGQSVEHTVDLGLGHIHVLVLGAQGQPIDKAGLGARAAPSGTPDANFASVTETNPLDLPVRAGTDYDITVRLSDGKSLKVQKKQVKEGETLELKVSVSDFK